MMGRGSLASPGWLLIALLAAGCGPAGDDDRGATRPADRVGGASGTERATEQVLRKGNGAEPETLDPHRAEGVPAANILRDLYEGLTIEAPDGEVVPGAAESWTISADGRVYTFRLREAARWSNGDPVTAEDFVYGLRRSADPATLSEYSAILYPIENAEAVTRGELPPSALRVRAIDAHTLEIRLHSPTPYLLGLLNHASTYPVHRPSLEQHGERFARAGNLVGNGAYRLDEWQVQSHIRLVRNPYYWA
ncbi:MAG: peptide ABC transporter substrate-binding protein, partial [bacterium]